MENKDYKSRLKNHKTPYNPDAWNQMAEMLDVLPVEVTEEKKDTKRWLRLFFLLGLAMLVLSLFFYMRTKHNFNSVSERHTSSSIESNETSSTHSNKGNVSTDLNNSTSNTDELNANDFNSQESTITEPNKKGGQKLDGINSSDLDNDNDHKSLQYASDDTEVNNTLNVRQNETSNAQNTNERKSGNQVSLSNNASKNVSGTGDTNAQGQSIDNTETKTPLSNTNVNQNQNTTINKSAVTLINSFNPLAHLPFGEINSKSEQRPYTLKELSDAIEIPRERKLYWFGSAGYGNINGEHGIQLGGGLFYDMDKVAAVSADLSVLRCRTSSFTYENSIFGSAMETSVTAWLHLNLFRKRKHKVSLELGPSLEYVWNPEKKRSDGTVTINQFSALDLNFRGGASYTYFIDKRTAVGFKGSFSLYDSTYASFQLYKKI